MGAPERTYVSRLEVDYPERLDRVTTFFRIVMVIPIAIVLAGDCVDDVDHGHPKLR